MLYKTTFPLLSKDNKFIAVELHLASKLNKWHIKRNYYWIDHSLCGKIKRDNYWDVMIDDNTATIEYMIKYVWPDKFCKVCKRRFWELVNV